MINYAFKIGDIVYLKSGGPAMTIAHIDYVRKEIPGVLYNTSVPTSEIYSISCRWFDNNKHISHAYLPPCALTYESTDIKLFNEYFGSVA